MRTALPQGSLDGGITREREDEYFIETGVGNITPLLRLGCVIGDPCGDYFVARGLMSPRRGGTCRRGTMWDG